MTHDEILNAARDRLAEIDRETARLDTQKAALTEERAKLAAMLGQPQPVAPFVAPMSQPPLPQPVVVTLLSYNSEPWRPMISDTWITTTPYVIPQHRRAAASPL
jgi:hypothetical protein